MLQIKYLLFMSGILLAFKPVPIKGRLTLNPDKRLADFDMVQIVVKQKGHLLKGTPVNKDGTFALSADADWRYAIDYYYVEALKRDTIYLGSAMPQDVTEQRINLVAPAIVKRNILTKVICPKCKKASEVYKISYSDAPVAVRTISAKGDTTYSPIYKGMYQAGCISTSAKYYCLRDRIKF